MCITSVPKTELFGFIYFFVRNPYVYKFWDLIFEENVKQTTTKKIQKAQFWARLEYLEYTSESRVKISTSNSKKPREKSHFSIWAQTLGAGRSGIYRKMRGLTDRTVVHVLYSTCCIGRLAAMLCSSFVSVSGASASASASVSVRF